MHLLWTYAFDVPRGVNCMQVYLSITGLAARACTGRLGMVQCLATDELGITNQLGA